MGELKTKETKASVTEFLQNVADPQQRKDALRVMKLMKEVTGQKPAMWGESMVGFGNYHYKYASGHEGDCFLMGFSPRKANLTLYIMPGFERYGRLMRRLGKYKTGKACLYIKRLDDIDWPTLEELVTSAMADIKGTQKKPKDA